MTQRDTTTRREITDQIRKVSNYQGYDLPGIRLPGHRKNMDARWDILLENCDPKGSTVLDLGCSNGFYCYKLAQVGAKATGVDRDSKAIALNRLITSHFGWDISFEEASLDLDYFEALPHYDVILFFSVLHHIFNHTFKHPAEYCQKIIHTLSRKCDVLLFDMGQSGEPFAWSRKLALMGPDPRQWILENLFEGTDFSDIQVVEPSAFTQGRWGDKRRWISEKHWTYTLSPRSSVRKLVTYALHKALIRNPGDTRYVFVASR